MIKNKTLCWLQNKFPNSSFEFKKLEPILYFSLLINYFEYKYFNNSKVTIDGLFELPNKFVIKDIKKNILPIFQHFKARYINQNQTNSKFNKLRLEPNKKIKSTSSTPFEYCKSVLLKDNPDSKEMTIVLLFILMRFRNNLFHGNKRTDTINIYEKQFKQLNNFLMFLMDLQCLKAKKETEDC